MAKYGIYRNEQEAEDDPYTTLRARGLRVEESVYEFVDQLGRIDAAYPTRHFYVVRLED